MNSVHIVSGGWIFLVLDISEFSQILDISKFFVVAYCSVSRIKMPPPPAQGSFLSGGGWSRQLSALEVSFQRVPVVSPVEFDLH